jgi:hypothetical protein
VLPPPEDPYHRRPCLPAGPFRKQFLVRVRDKFVDRGLPTAATRSATQGRNWPVRTSGSSESSDVGWQAARAWPQLPIVHVPRKASKGVASLVVNISSSASLNSSCRAYGMLTASKPFDINSPDIISRAARLLPSK